MPKTDTDIHSGESIWNYKNNVIVENALFVKLIFINCYYIAVIPFNVFSRLCACVRVCRWVSTLAVCVWACVWGFVLSTFVDDILYWCVVVYVWVLRMTSFFSRFLSLLPLQQCMLYALRPTASTHAMKSFVSSFVNIWIGFPCGSIEMGIPQQNRDYHEFLGHTSAMIFNLKVGATATQISVRSWCERRSLIPSSYRAHNILILFGLGLTDQYRNGDSVLSIVIITNACVRNDLWKFNRFVCDFSTTNRNE